MTTKTKLSSKPFFLAALIWVALMPFTLFAQTVTTVTECNLNGWVKNTPSASTVSFVNGPAVPPSGKGSIQFNAPVPAFVRVRNTSYSGILLASLTELTYATYVQQSATNLEAPFIVLQVDNDLNGTVDASLVFNPRWQTGRFITAPQVPDQGLIQKNVWQTWDALNGGWWTGPAPNPDDGGVMYPLSSYINQHPNARIMNDAGGGGIRLNGSAPTIFSGNFIGNADAFTIGINGHTTVFDFELGIDTGPDKTVYHGYENCTTLSGTTAVGNEPLHYNWLAGGQTIAIDQEVTVCPTNTTTYTLMVTDANGCSRTDNVTVVVQDVRCGSKMDKVIVCHQGIPLCISPNAVEAHLKHGDELGGCSSSTAATATNARSEMPEEAEERGSSDGIRLFPNPVHTVLGVQLRVTNEKLLIFDAAGRVVNTISLIQTGEISISIDVSNLPVGTYFLQNGKEIRRFIRH